MSIEKLRTEITSFFEEVAELREKARKLTRGSDEWSELIPIWPYHLKTPTKPFLCAEAPGWNPGFQDSWRDPAN